MLCSVSRTATSNPASLRKFPSIYLPKFENFTESHWVCTACRVKLANSTTEFEAEPNISDDETSSLSSLSQTLRLSLEQDVYSQKSAGSEYVPISQSISSESTHVEPSDTAECSHTPGTKRTLIDSVLQVSPVKRKRCVTNFFLYPDYYFLPILIFYFLLKTLLGLIQDHTRRRNITIFSKM